MIRGPDVRVIPLSELRAVLQVYANVICEFVRDLTSYELSAAGLQTGEQGNPVSPQDFEQLKPIVQQSADITKFFWMPGLSARNERIAAALLSKCTYSELAIQLRMLREALEDDLKSVLVLYMPAGQAVNFYAGDQLLGAAVVARFPNLATDIDEAGKCLGSGRYTAAVFHLMRVLEVGVQQFGDKLLCVTLIDSRNKEKGWQNTLDEADKTIRALPQGTPRTAKLAELSSLLYAVKLAWRNQVMHPKAVYSPDEAERILSATRAFMETLVATMSNPDMPLAPLVGVVPDSSGYEFVAPLGDSQTLQPPHQTALATGT